MLYSFAKYADFVGQIGALNSLEFTKKDPIYNCLTKN